MHRLIAALLCLIGLVAAGLAVASATVWRPSDTLRAEATADGSTLLVTDPGVLDLAAAEVTVVATAPGEVVLALGRTSDVDAWVGTDAHTRVTGLVDRTTLATAEGTTSAPEATASPEPTASPETTASPDAADDAADDAAAAEGEADAATAAPDPTGSDLWLEEVRGDGRAELALTDRPGRFSIIAASVGEDAGPPTLTLEWPQEVRTPWLVPGVVVGGLLVLLGVLWFVLALRRERRDRGGSRRRRAARGVPKTSAPATPAPVAPAPGRTAPDAPAPSGAPAGASTTSTSPTWTVTPGEPPATARGTERSVPLTRRQLREMERRREAEAADRTRGPGSGPVPTSGTPSATGSEQAPPTGSRPAPTTGSGQAQDPSTGPVSVPTRGPVSRLSDRFQRRVRPTRESPTTPSPATPTPATPPGPAPRTGATSGPTTGPGEPDAGRPAVTPTWPVRSTSPNATAEAWRRAWGFPATGADPATGEAGERRPDDTEHRPDDAHDRPDEARVEEDR